MKERDVSVRARRTTRVAIALPVRIAAFDPGRLSEAVNGRSVVVNKHGCRLESAKSLPLGQIADITVLATQKSARGKVIWADPRPQKSGNYEFALEFDKPCNLWNLNFPPEDWELEQEREIAAAEAGAEQAISAEPSDPPVPPIHTELPAPDAAGASISETVNSEVPGTPPQEFELAQAHREPAHDAAPQDLDLAAEFDRFAAEIGSDLSPENPTADLDFPQAPTENHETPTPPPAVTQSSETAIASFVSAHSKVSAAPIADPVSLPVGVEIPRGSPHKPADRLAEAVRELIQSTVSDEQGVAAERLVKTLEERMARMQLDVLDRLTNQVQILISAQTSVLEQRAGEIANNSQQILSVGLQQLAETAEQKAKAIQGEAASAVAAALDSLHSRVAEQLPQTEKSFLDQCRSLAEQSLSGLLENSLRTMSQRINEVSKDFEKIEERTQKVLLDTSAQLEQHSAMKIDETTKHLETQLLDTAQNINTSFQRDIVAELGKRQQVIETAFRQQMQAVSESSVQEMQGALARMLQGLAEKMHPAPDRRTSDSNNA